jgi:hypothetical protein
MIAFFTDPANTFLTKLHNPAVTPTLSSVFTAAQSGQLLSAFGVNYKASPYDPTQLGKAGNGYGYTNTALSTFYLGLVLLKPGVLSSVKPGLNPQLPLTGPFPPGTLISDNTLLGTTTFDLVGKGVTVLNSQADNPERTDLFFIQSNDPVQFDVTSLNPNPPGNLVPEPSSVLLGSIGLVCLGGLAWWRRLRIAGLAA